MKKIKGTTDNRIIQYQDCLDIIHNLKFGEKSNIFGIERDNGLESIINNIYQSFDGQDILYIIVSRKNQLTSYI